MKKINIILGTAFVLASMSFIISSCKKDVAPSTPASPTPVVNNSIFEEFDDVSEAVTKGWVIKNNSNPAGANAWGQGRYENNLGGSKAGRVIGMPAYSASKSPFDYVSVDATCVNSVGAINCWLISPQTTVKNGDVLSFFTRAMNDQDWSNFAKDRMQVRANFVDGSVDCGVSAADSGKFMTRLLDINPTMANNDPGGYPQAWRKYTITISGLATRTKARFAFRYLSATGVSGGLGGTNASSLIGVDQFEFKSN